MGRPYTRIHRLLRLLTLIQSDRRWNARRLAQELGTTERNIYRDLKELEGAGVPVFFDKEAGGYSVRHDFFMPPVQLALDEALALIVVGEQIGGEEQVPFTKPALRAIEKIRGQLRKLDAGLGAVVPHVRVRLAASEPGDGFRDVYEIVRQAIADRRALRCAYESLQPTPSQKNRNRAGSHFLFKPYCLFFGQRSWYAVGWHGEHKGPRSLKLSRFARCELTDQPYAIPDGFSLSQYLGNAWRMIRGDRSYRVELRFDAEFADTVEETQWHDTQRVTRHDDGSITFRCEVDGLEEIVWWVMGYGPHCRVVKPRELAKRVAGLARAMVERYGD